MFVNRYAMNKTADFETVREIKEKLCYIRYAKTFVHSLEYICFKSVLFSSLLAVMTTRESISLGLRQPFLLRIIL